MDTRVLAERPNPVASVVALITTFFPLSTSTAAPATPPPVAVVAKPTSGLANNEPPMLC